MQCGLDVAYEMVVTTSAARGGVNAESKIPSENAQIEFPTLVKWRPVGTMA